MQARPEGLLNGNRFLDSKRRVKFKHTLRIPIFSAPPGQVPGSPFKPVFCRVNLVLQKTTMSDKEEKKDPFDGDYVGNIWGWKFSLFGAALILLLLVVIAYRHYTLDVPLGLEDPLKREAAPADSSRVDTARGEFGRE